jgi:hypothetical protein
MLIKISAAKRLTKANVFLSTPVGTRTITAWVLKSPFAEGLHQFAADWNYNQAVAQSCPEKK